MSAGQKYDRQYSHCDACIDLLTMPVDQFSPFHPQQSPILGSPDRIADFFVQPFILDLEDEILERSTPEQKADLLKRYLSRLRKSKNHLSVEESKTSRGVTEQGMVANEIPSVLLPRDGLLIMDIPQNDNYGLKFKQGCNILYHLLFDELQKCCVTYNIPFLGLCKELNFDIEIVNIEYSLKNGPGQLSPAVEIAMETKAQPELKSTSGPNIEGQFTEIMNSENKFWRGLPMDFVVNHFKVMTIKKSSNGKPFLTELQLIAFLRKGFLKFPNEIKQTINYSYGEKGFVIKRFYELYVFARGEYNYPQSNENFINLIHDCFNNNWNITTIVMLFKPNKANKKW